MGRYTSDDNRSMQLNDNNDRYYSSRGIDRDELDYDFEEDDDNTQGDNMSFFKIDKQMVRKSTITHIEPSYDLSFKRETVTINIEPYYCREDERYQREKDLDVLIVSPCVFLKIHTSYGKTFLKEINSKGLQSRWPNTRKSFEITDCAIFDIASEPERNGRPAWQHYRILETDTVFKSSTFNEKVLNDYLDKYLFIHANQCMIKLLGNIDKIEE